MWFTSSEANSSNSSKPESTDDLDEIFTTEECEEFIDEDDLGAARTHAAALRKEREALTERLAALTVRERELKVKTDVDHFETSAAVSSARFVAKEAIAPQRETQVAFAPPVGPLNKVWMSFRICSAEEGF